MALEISEIGIRMHVRDGASGSDGGQAEPGSAGAAADGSMTAGHEAIVEECVRRVLRALKTRQER
jgi:hypothetical protein